MKKMLCCLGIALSLCFTGCTDESEDPKSSAVADTQLNLVIDYEANLVMAKDPADIYIDGEKQFSVLNGETNYSEVMVSHGNHTITVDCGGYTDSEEIAVESSSQAYQFHKKNHTSYVELSFIGNVPLDGQ